MKLTKKGKNYAVFYFARKRFFFMIMKPLLHREKKKAQVLTSLPEVYKKNAFLWCTTAKQKKSRVVFSLDWLLKIWVCLQEGVAYGREAWFFLFLSFYLPEGCGLWAWRTILSLCEFVAPLVSRPLPNWAWGFVVSVAYGREGRFRLRVRGSTGIK